MQPASTLSSPGLPSANVQSVPVSTVAPVVPAMETNAGAYTGTLEDGFLPLRNGTVTLVPHILRPAVSRKMSTESASSDDVLRFANDSIANIDISDLKADNECDLDEAGSFSLPPLSPLSQHAPSSVHIDNRQSLMNTNTDHVPPYVHTPPKHSKSSVSSTHVFPAATTADIPTTSLGNNVNYVQDGYSEDNSTRARSTSPEISQIILATPRSRNRSTSRSRLRTSSYGREGRGSVASRSRMGSGVPPPVPRLSPNVMRSPVIHREYVAAGATLGELEDGGIEGRGDVGDEGHDSDSSLDLHTPLP